MKEIVLKVYKFDELSKDSQEKMQSKDLKQEGNYETDSRSSD